MITLVLAGIVLPANQAAETARAGFTPAGTIQSHVPATGQTYDDLRFVLCRH